MYVVVRVVAGRDWEIVERCRTRLEAEWVCEELADQYPARTFRVDMVSR